MVNQGSYLRPAVLADMLLLFGWANDPEVRKRSFHSASIPLEKHADWYKACMASHDVVMYIMEHDHEPVGQLRYQIEDGTATTNYSIADCHRGKGYGTWIVRMSDEKLLSERTDIHRIVAYVKHDNPASVSVFEKNGYTRSDNGSYYTFEKEVCE